MTIEEEMKYLHNYQMSGMIDNPKRLYFSGDNVTIFMKSEVNYLISFSELKKSDDHCYLRMLYIPEHFRGNGLGSIIVNKLIILCKEYDIKAIEVESENNSIDFFKNLGFKFILSEEKNRMRYEF